MAIKIMILILVLSYVKYYDFFLHEGISPTPADGLCVIANDKGLDKVFNIYKIEEILYFYCSVKHKISEAQDF